MIPSEFNQDLMAQRRKLRLLHEARGAAARRAYLFKDRVTANKFADFVGEQGNMDAESFKPASGGRINVTVAFQNQRDVKKIDAAHDKFRGIKEEYITEKVTIVGVDNKSGELFLLVPGGQKSEAGRRLSGMASFAGGTFKHPGRDRSGSPDVFSFKVPKLKPLALSQFLRTQLKDLF